MGVAARAECPVVSVPDGWTPDEDRSRSVVVGFEAADLDVALLDHALVRATELGARLTVLHAWELPGFYDDIIVRRTHDTDWNRGAQERIEEQVARVRPDHPGVEVEVQVLHRQPALALREASESAGLLILGRHGQRPILRHLGGTARALLREASCAVEIVPPVAVAAATATSALAEVGEARQ
jgi:nucleotide-binding universal stress UspA family protein